MTGKIAVPPEPLNEDGNKRLVGVEIEFAGLTVAEAAALVQERFGGTVSRETLHRHHVEDTDYGTFTVELDAQLVHGDAPGKAEEDLLGDLEGKVREVIGSSVAGLVPVEIVAPPIPWDELERLNALFDRLRESGAEGTEDSPLNGFGLHLNPEVARQDADYVVRHLRAFLVLSDWLRDSVDVDLMRRLMPHIQPYPRDYVLKAVEPDYAPDLSDLIDDYIADNPTRNRELDCLPLFRFLDEKRVTSQVDSELIKARPTFHYRLPNSSLSRPGWNAVVEWNRWVKVEELAADRSRLSDASIAYRDYLLLPASRRLWDELVERLTR